MAPAQATRFARSVTASALSAKTVRPEDDGVGSILRATSRALIGGHDETDGVRNKPRNEDDGSGYRPLTTVVEEEPI